MPPRRRTAVSSAAALPASRLPVGTPRFSASRSPTTTRSKSRSPPRLEKQNTNSSSDHSSAIDSGQENLDPAVTMPPQPSTEDVSAKSIAEAKLERQRMRNEVADAMTGAQPPPLDRRAQTSRGKANKWKHFDFTADTSTHSQHNDGGVQLPVSEVRINTFRAASREPSLTRSISALSQRTSETGSSAMERQDSGLTEAGFQPVFKGRRNRRNIGELSAYEDKPEERQITVEANYDKREISDVFGNALPGPEFLPQNPGFTNGQLQFIQHPNGDISAQLWVLERFEWQNIGQFSNIRKKVEGQLASDRLKGETASQTLKQNTLAYFRTIAKQREANVMGLPFGAREIQAAMPEARTEMAAAPTGLKDSRNDSQPPEATSAPQPASMYNSHPPASDSADQLHFKVEPPRSASKIVPAVPNIAWNTPPPRAPRADRREPPTSFARQDVRQEDPFYPNNHYQQIYGGYQHQPPYYNQQPQPPAQPITHYYPTTQQPVPGLNYNFHFPTTDPANYIPQGPGAQAYFADQAAHVNSVERQWQQAQAYRQHGVSGQGFSQHHTTITPNRLYPAQESDSNRYNASAEIAAPRPVAVTSFSSSKRMSEHLWDISEHAKERSLSQNNIRTVLYDPYQSQASAAQVQQQPQPPEKQHNSPTFAKHVANKTLQPPDTLNAHSSNFFPTVLAPQVPTSSSPERGAVENNLKDSSPDTQWTHWSKDKKPHEMHNTPTIAATSAHRAQPQDHKDPFVTHIASAQPSHQAKAPLLDRQKAYDKELKDWWTSGNTFARQEEFFQSIKASYQDPNVSSPPARITPIGPPSRTTKQAQEQVPPFNETTTRLLIPVLENLASYVQGPVEKRRDYFSQWCKPPEWCIDRSEGGNNSFFDDDWGQPPARVGRDPRYNQSRSSWSGEQRTPQNNRYGSGHYGYGSASRVASGGSAGYGSASRIPSGGSAAYGAGGAVNVGIDRRFAFGGRR